MKHTFDLGSVATSPSSTFDRLLVVLQAIAVDGPISLAELSSSLRMSRGAVWRATDALRRHGWVRMRHSDNALELSHQLDHFFARAHIAWPESWQFDTLLQAVANTKFVHASVGLFAGPGKFVTADSTYRYAPIGQPLSFAYEDLYLAAQIGMSESEHAFHIKAYLKKCDREEIAAINSEDYSDRVLLARLDGLIWSVDRLSFSVPIAFDTGAKGSVSFFVRNTDRKCIEKLHLLGRKLQSNWVSNTRSEPGFCVAELRNDARAVLDVEDYKACA